MRGRRQSTPTVEVFGHLRFVGDFRCWHETDLPKWSLNFRSLG